jgi:hypothetical protein
MAYWTMTLYWSTVMVVEHEGVGRQPTSLTYAAIPVAEVNSDMPVLAEVVG